jgi:hypothetical protein
MTGHALGRIWVLSGYPAPPQWVGNVVHFLPPVPARAALTAADTLESIQASCFELSADEGGVFFRSDLLNCHLATPRRETSCRFNQLSTR